MLVNPSAKDFFNITTFLFKELDPSLVFDPSKFQDELPVQFKNFKYPFQISKRALSGVGSPHTWPPLLAALTWIVELLTYEEVLPPYLRCQEAQEVQDEELGQDTEVFYKRAFYDNTLKAYHEYICGSDEFPELDEELAQIFGMVQRDDNQNPRSPLWPRKSTI